MVNEENLTERVKDTYISVIGITRGVVEPEHRSSTFYPNHLKLVQKDYSQIASVSNVCFTFFLFCFDHLPCMSSLFIFSDSLKKNIFKD